MEEDGCSCSNKADCTLQNKCLAKNLVYQTTILEGNGTEKNYIGLASTTFKARLGVHKNSFKDLDANQTALSTHIWSLKEKKIDFKISWKIVDRALPFSPVSGTCALCTKEKYYILFHSDLATLNKKSEIYANCRHKKSNLLIKKPKKKRTPRRNAG